MKASDSSGASPYHDYFCPPPLMPHDYHSPLAFGSDGVVQKEGVKFPDCAFAAS